MTMENNKTINLIDKLDKEENLSKEEFIYILENTTFKEREYLSALALKKREKYYGNQIFLRGLIEFTNYCKNDCHYCGIRQKNKNVSRYRLTKNQILECCAQGYTLGMRTFVLQGGEDPYFDDKLVDIVKEIREKYSDCAITLSVGELSKKLYKDLFDAGANRFLLRHETATSEHYEKLHPTYMTLSHRMRCLNDIKEIGYQTGAGFMVGSPYQTNVELAEDLVYLKKLNPHMVGIGPFIPHKDSVFKDYKSGTLEKTLTMLALTRLMLPKAMLPSTTALETIERKGRVQGYLSGANVIMVNISPTDVKKDYLLYDNKAFINTDAQKAIENIKKELDEIGMVLPVAVGNAL